MAGLIDGLGGEEVDQTTNVKTAYVYATTEVSGLNVFAQGSGTFGRITNANGVLFPSIVGSPSVYGATIKAGTLATSAGSAGIIVFGTPYASTSWFAVLTAGSSGGVNQAYVSGARNVSGAEVVGGASITYNYIAVGL